MHRPALPDSSTSSKTSFVSHSLEDFDPLLTGQLVLDTPADDVSTNSSVSSLNRKSTDEDLLKDWSLDFVTKKASNHAMPSMSTATTGVGMKPAVLSGRPHRPWSTAPDGFVRKLSQVCNDRDVAAAHQQQVIRGVHVPTLSGVYTARSRETSPAPQSVLTMVNAPLSQRIAKLESKQAISRNEDQPPPLPSTAPPPLPKTAPPSQDPFSDLLDVSLMGVNSVTSSRVGSSYPSIASFGSIGLSRFGRGLSPPRSSLLVAKQPLASRDVTASSGLLNTQQTPAVSSSSQLAWEKFE